MKGKARGSTERQDTGCEGLSRSSKGHQARQSVKAQWAGAKGSKEQMQKAAARGGLPQVIHQNGHQAQLISKAQQNCQAVRVNRHAVAVL